MAVGVMFRNGKVLFRNGKVLFGETNCVCCPACQYCPDAEPNQYDITFSGVVMCTVCWCYAPGVSCDLIVSGELDGTYRVTRDASDPCLWLGTASITGRFWNSSECAGAPDQEVTSFIIQLRRVSGEFQLSVSGDISGAPGPIWNLFTGTGASTNCASGLPTINNTITECEGTAIGDPIEGAYDGSATLAVV